MTLVNMRRNQPIYSAQGRSSRHLRLAVLGNGRLYLGFDSSSCLREMFYPVIGLENHVAETGRSRPIILEGEDILEISSDAWEISGSYDGGMSFHWDLSHRLGPARLSMTDVVDPYEPIWIRRLEASSGSPPTGFYMRFSLALKENTIGEAGFWDPEKSRLYHYKGSLWVASRMVGGDCIARIAKVRDGGANVLGPTGAMTGSSVDHGFIESVIGLKPDGESCVTLAVALGESRDVADRRLDDALLMGYKGALARTRTYWAGHDDISTKVLASHCDSGGGILASCDTAVMGDFRDHYRYVWTRDAAMCASTLIRQGLTSFGRRYLEFCAGALSEEGFFWQRHRADRHRGSGWHPVDLPDGSLPIQEDETALSLVTAGDYFEETRELSFLDSIFDSFVSKAAGFIQGYVQENGLLVRPSFDLWEERKGIFSFTQATCIAGLYWASMIARALGRPVWSGFRESSFMLLKGLVTRLCCAERGFARGLTDTSCQAASPLDWTPDSSLYLIPLLLWPVEYGADGGPLKEQALMAAAVTWKRLSKNLAIQSGQGFVGVGRYLGDWYARPEDAGTLPGNIWPVCSGWRLLSGKRLGLLPAEEYERGCAVFEKARLSSGVMSEQLDCVRLRPSSVAPLVWAHATYLDVVSAFRDENQGIFS